MEQFPRKVKLARIQADLSQAELGERVGVSVKSINAYENGRALPRKYTLRKLAKELGVTVEYLSSDDVDDPKSGKRKEMRLDAVRSRFGEKTAREIGDLIERNTAFFAGGDIDQESKDAYFDLLMETYLECKEVASEKFTPKGVRKRKKTSTPDS